MRKIISISLSIVLQATGVAASAQDPAPTRPVVYADLDLNTAAGRAALDRRLAVATEDVCGSYAGAAPAEARAIDRCRAIARSRIQTQLAILYARNAQLALGSR